MTPEAQHYLDMWVALDELKGRIKQVEGDMSAMEPVVMRLLEEGGIDAFSMYGMEVYRRDDIKIHLRKGASTRQVVERLKSSADADLVSESYNTGSLKARLRQYHSTGENSPVDDLVDVEDVSSLRVRKAK